MGGETATAAGLTGLGKGDKKEHILLGQKIEHILLGHTVYLTISKFPVSFGSEKKGIYDLYQLAVPFPKLAPMRLGG